MARRSTKEDLIKAGIQEINKNGIHGFSMRRVADACGISCGAPYKHFGDKNAFIAALYGYVTDQWQEAQEKILEAHPGDLRAQIVEMCVGYARFLMEKPHFRALLTMKDEAFDSAYQCLRGELSGTTVRLAGEYCDSVGMDPSVRKRKIYVIRALIYGAIIMFDNGELSYDDEAMEILRYNIAREFDLP
ncbi:MAG: TetR/AcrR family transcriptional regulator [Ruminiclostridium sp.]|nr:TetR/AcrR family transcriptional regulator [Ruminiclostridium sp.]